MKIRIVDDGSAYRKFCTEVERLSGGYKWPPVNSAAAVVILTRAGFSQLRIEQYLGHKGVEGFDDAGELPGIYRSASGGDYPIFSATLIEGLTRWHEQHGTPVREPGDDSTLDERAVATKVLHPEWSDQQVADAIGCSRQSLFKPNMVKYRQAKAALKSGRERYRQSAPRNDADDV